MNPIIAMLHNTKEDKYHPILFLCYPTPSGMENRYKSKVHHTNGFSIREEAVKFANKELLEFSKKFGDPSISLNKDFVWDGEDFPAMVVFFTEDTATGEMQPII